MSPVAPAMQKTVTLKLKTSEVSNKRPTLDVCVVLNTGLSVSPID